ncbi:GspE/PulE family protein [Sphingomonas qomolangmaensis]|uniref:ATPase, T2SS/T4P/T4SS family n=1 Tax=Sphingomonas qomolangmaensis TaxID=2918765 RepID=A0ABY5LBM5_9SPHN|nr:ATPase, T2SS/T4P/T4SS family [Sphingomonas qomolangmaensis]UUL83220.1 ATPase, T2SS/T4P/T4SS family [Sphingomonas qomolangmaensis]
MLDRVLAECIARRGGTIHVDLSDEALAIRIRVHGALHEVLALRGSDATALRGCLFDRAGLIAGQGEGRLTAAGRDWLAYRVDTTDGARVVLQHMGTPSADEPLAAIGMSPALVRTIDSALLDAAGGIVVVAGPAGSGSAATLRAILARVNVGTRRSLAIQRTAEAADAGVGRVTVDAADPRGTAAALRLVLRQDPDIVMLDDLPDRETAQMAFEAARTRRLLLLGVEADDAVGAIARLRALRVERFLLASTLRIVVAQRLVRRLCVDCRRPVQASAAASALLGFDPGSVIYTSDGCDACAGSGFAGQVAVFEAIACDPAISRLLNDGGDAAILSRHAFVAAPNLGSAARALVREGRTTPEEALRISRGGAAVTA